MYSFVCSETIITRKSDAEIECPGCATNNPATVLLFLRMAATRQPIAIKCTVYVYDENNKFVASITVPKEGCLHRNDELLVFLGMFLDDEGKKKLLKDYFDMEMELMDSGDKLFNLLSNTKYYVCITGSYKHWSNGIRHDFSRAAKKFDDWFQWELKMEENDNYGKEK